MLSITYAERRRLEALSRPELVRHQLGRLGDLLQRILPTNRFYAEKLAGHLSEARLARPGGPIDTLDELAELPLTTKDELLSPRGGVLARNLTYPREHYVRMHQTSGTRGRPLMVLDTAEDWRWWLDAWQYVLDAAELTPEDAVLLAFSFGPFIGFWSAHEAAAARGLLVLPGGGMGTLARLELIRTAGATAIFCTPSYALHMAEIAAEHQIDTRTLGIRTLVLAGEAGGSVPAVRERITEAWNARVLDHSGATEMGPWGYGNLTGGGLHVMEAEFIAEFLSVNTGHPASEGELSELVLTNLGRIGAPLIRYRTGDLVRPTFPTTGPNRFVFLEGGVLSRADDMMVIRGVNIFPSSIDHIVRTFPEVVEYRMTATTTAAMDQLLLEVEDRLQKPERIAAELQLRLGLKVEVVCLPPLTLPRFEAKARRFIDRRERVTAAQ